MPEPAPPTPALTLVTDAAEGLTVESRSQFRLSADSGLFPTQSSFNSLSWSIVFGTSTS